MNQTQKAELKAQVTNDIAEAFAAKGLEVTEIVEGVHVVIEGMNVVIKAVVKKDTFDLADAIEEREDKIQARIDRGNAKAKKLADAEAKKASKAKAKAETVEA